MSARSATSDVPGLVEAVEDAAPHAVAIDQARAREHVEMGRDGARRVAQAPGELGRRRRPVERAEHRRAAVAEEEVEAVVELGRLGRPQLRGAARLVADRHRPLALGDAHEHAAGEDEGDEHERAPPQVHVVLLLLEELDDRIAPADRRMQLVEHGAGPGERPARGHGRASRPRARRAAAATRRPAPRPSRRASHRRGDRSSRAAGRAKASHGGGGSSPQFAAMSARTIAGSVARTTSISSARRRQRIDRDRRGEVRDVLGQRDVEVERAQVDAAQRAARSGDPWAVLVDGLLVVQPEQAARRAPTAGSAPGACARGRSARARCGSRARTLARRRVGAHRFARERIASRCRRRRAPARAGTRRSARGRPPAGG